jgi:hypothetical protein
MLSQEGERPGTAAPIFRTEGNPGLKELQRKMWKHIKTQCLERRLKEAEDTDDRMTAANENNPAGTSKPGKNKYLVWDMLEILKR